MRILSILTIIYTFSQCASLKLEKNPPFNITSAIYNNWVGGVQGNAGMNLKINYTSNKPILFDSIYFSNRIVKLETNNVQNKKIIVGHFKTSNRKKDLTLNRNIIKEIKNKFPTVRKMPFKLDYNEAIISYRINKITKYYKIKSIKKGRTIYYPSAPKK